MLLLLLLMILILMLLLMPMMMILTLIMISSGSPISTFGTIKSQLQTVGELIMILMMQVAAEQLSVSS